MVESEPAGARQIYLSDVPLEEARRVWLQALRARGLLGPLEAEAVAAAESLHRVTAAPVYAAGSTPHYHASAVDGIAVRAEETFGASETSPVRLGPGRFRPVNTGDPLPSGFDAVVMVEDIHESPTGEVELIGPAVPWQHVRPVGEDIVVTELLLPTNHRIRPPDLGALLAAGVREVPVRRRPRLLIIPTGDELMEPGRPPAPGAIIEFNSHVLAAMAQEWGALTDRHAPVCDDPVALADALLRGRDHDLVVVNAGASAGTRDFAVDALRRVGEVILHGVAIKPGRPTILGIVGKTPVVGIPGYPVTSMLTFDLFVKPMVFMLQGLPVPRREVVRAVTTRTITSVMGLDEFVRVKLGEVGGRLVASPLGRGAGLISTMVRADGLLTIPRSSEGVAAGREVEVELLRAREEIARTLVVVGSHDVALDLLADFLRRRDPGVSLSSAHVGSLGGLGALRRREAHMSGIHLLDEETGEYNVPYVRRYLPGEEVVLVTLAHRDQGLIVRPGNPRAIAGLEDLVREDVVFINRQRGAGTRLLLEFTCKRAGIDPTQIRGYEREAYTHMAVAAAVASGTADAGLGIYAAARALGLDFIPVARERYDLVIPREHLEAPLVQEALAVLNSAEFQEEVRRLGGYDTTETGRITPLEPVRRA
ncbi:MAG: molybdopterin biosynthesis protein [Armatimonadota bacterium]|nr:molybdopterin biosynthesis protein [Armatimonadota bacterium]